MAGRIPASCIATPSRRRPIIAPTRALRHSPSLRIPEQPEATMAGRADGLRPIIALRRRRSWAVLGGTLPDGCRCSTVVSGRECGRWRSRHTPAWVCVMALAGRTLLASTFSTEPPRTRRPSGRPVATFGRWATTQPRRSGARGLPRERQRNTTATSPRS